MSGVLHNIEEKLLSFGHEFSGVSELHNHVIELKDLLIKENNSYNVSASISHGVFDSKFLHELLEIKHSEVLFERHFSVYSRLFDRVCLE